MKHRRCFFLRLEIAGIVVAVLDALKSLVILGVLIYLIIDVNRITDELAKGSNKVVGNKDAITRRLIAMIVVALVFHATLFFTAVVMIIGTIMSYHDYILPWLVVSLCVLILHFIDIVLFLTSSRDQMTELRSPAAITALVVVVCFGVFAYFVELQIYRVIRIRNVV